MAVLTIQDTADIGAGVLAGDTLIITGKELQNITNLTTNIDQSGLGAGGLAAVRVTRNFRAQFGSVATPFKAEVAAGSAGIFHYDAESGDCYYVPDGNANVCNKLRVTGPGCHMHLLGGVACTVDNLEQGAGTVTVASDITPTTVKGSGGYMSLEGESGTPPTTVYAGGTFRLRLARGPTTMYVFDDARVSIDAATDTITTLWSLGGHLDLFHSGTITTWNLFAGDASRISVARAITVTTLNVWPTVRNRDSILRHPLITVGTLNTDINPIPRAA
jgi:hypothetical protein